MADDQSPKTSSIDELVKELTSKSLQSQGGGSRMGMTGQNQPSASIPTPPQQKTNLFPTPLPPRTPVPTPLSISPKHPEPPKPQPSTIPPPPSASKPVQPSPTPPSSTSTREYQSSIRTMSDDMARLNQGQKPMGTDVPRKIEQIAPMREKLTSPKITPPPPAQTSSQFKIPQVNLGETQKSAPLVQSKELPKPPTLPIKEQPKAEVYIPEAGKGEGINRNMIFVGVVVLAVVLGGFFYWFFVLRTPGPGVEPVESPTPTLTPTETPTQSLDSIFKDIPTENVEVSNPGADINVAISDIEVSGGLLKRLIVKSVAKGQMLLNLPDFLAVQKQELTSVLEGESIVLLYGQKELFDSNGQAKVNMVEGRIVFINEVNGESQATQTMNSWEVVMTNDLSDVFSLSGKSQVITSFSGNYYRGVDVRYRNYPFADRSIDYAIVQASNGKSYLVLTNSRESIYGVIDKLKGF